MFDPHFDATPNVRVEERSARKEQETIKWEPMTLENPGFSGYKIAIER